MVEPQSTALFILLMVVFCALLVCVAIAKQPAVLVMPDANGGPRISSQCLNVHDGPQDATFMGVDVQNALSHALRVVPSGRAWGIAGYSEGGYCAATSH